MGEDWVEVLDLSEKNQHSKLGIASCVVVLIVWGLLFPDVLDIIRPVRLDGPPTDFKIIEIIRRVPGCVQFPLLLLGNFLGFISFRKSNSKSSFGFVGLVANLGTLLMFGVFFLCTLVFSWAFGGDNIFPDLRKRPLAD
jgi:hypothetical protein